MMLRIVFYALALLACVAAPAVYAATAILEFSATVVNDIEQGDPIIITGHYLLDTETPPYGRQEYRFAVIEGTVVAAGVEYAAQTTSGFTGVFVNDYGVSGDALGLVGRRQLTRPPTSSS